MDRAAERVAVHCDDEFVEAVALVVVRGDLHERVHRVLHAGGGDLGAVRVHAIERGCFHDLVEMQVGEVPHRTERTPLLPTRLRNGTGSWDHAIRDDWCEYVAHVIHDIRVLRRMLELRTQALRFRFRTLHAALHLHQLARISFPLCDSRRVELSYVVATTGRTRMPATDPIFLAPPLQGVAWHTSRFRYRILRAVLHDRVA